MGFLESAQAAGEHGHCDDLTSIVSRSTDTSIPIVRMWPLNLTRRPSSPNTTLAYGSSGLSNAFLIAEKLGFSDEVLRRAREHQTGGEQEITEALTELERLKAAARKDQQELLRSKRRPGWSVSGCGISWTGSGKKGSPF